MNTSLSTAIALVSRVPRIAPKSNGLAASGNVAGFGATGWRTGGGVRLSAGVSDSVFSINSTDVTKQKLRLMERVGKAFGVSMDDFKDMRSFGKAIREQMAGMDPATLKVMEAGLGLTQLGVRLVDVVEAMEDPGGAADDKLDTALRKEAGETKDADKKHPLRISVDDIGRYGPIRRSHDDR